MEPQPEHRRAADEQPVRGREPIDASQRRALDAVRQLRRAGGRRAQQVAQELRTPAGPLGGERHDVRRKRRRVGDRLGQGEGVGSLQGLKLQVYDVGAGRGREAAGAVAPRYDHEPRQQPQLAGERVHERRRRGVHQVDVGDLDQGPARQLAAQEAEHDVVQASGAEVGRELLDGGCVPHGDVERDGEQRQPRQQRRIVALERRAQPLVHDVVWIVCSDAQHLAQQVAPGPVRRR